MTITGRPTWLEIDLKAIVHNYRLATRCGAGVWPVVKADGYGLGAVPVALALQRAGAEGFCVSLVSEAEVLRQAGITQPMALFSGFGVGEESQVGRLGVEPFLFRLEDGERLSQAMRGGQSVAVHLKIDTGMGRLGVSPEEAPAALASLQRLPGLRVVGLVSHLACADTPDHPANRWQIERLRSVLALPEARGLRVSLANSAGLLALPESCFDWVRPGIMLYGASPLFPARRAKEEGLRPVVSWHSTVVQVRSAPAGAPLGYGHTAVTQRPSRIAQLPVGYGDGYCRCLGNGVGQVLVAGRRAPVVGRVCMDLLAVDVTELPGVAVGDEVTLLGEDGDDFIGIEEMAHWCHTIPYEVICRLTARNTRLYRE